MSRDYKDTARREKSSSKGSPFFSGFLIGLLMGVGISLAVAIFINRGDSPFVNKEPTEKQAQPAAQNKDTRVLPKENAPEASEKSRFDFYTILPGSESQVTEQEIKQKEKQPEASVVKENYFLQVGAFQTEEEADNMKAKLALLGLEAIVQTANIPDKGVWHRVRVGPYTDLEQINKYRAELVQNGFDPVLVKVHSKSADQAM